MDEQFSRTELGIDLKALQCRDDGPGLRQLSAQALLFAASGLWLCMAEGWLLPIALVLHATLHFALFGLLHEACHRTVFVKPEHNRWAGWFAALAQPMSPEMMRSFHFAHHRHTHELAEDPELGGLPFMAAWPKGVLGGFFLTGVPVLLGRTAWSLGAAVIPTDSPAFAKALPFVPESRRRRVQHEARLLLLGHGLLLAVGVWIYPPLLRCYAALLLGHAFLSLYITCEHRGLPAASPGQDVLERTRSLDTGPLLRWLLWNMPYHAEHHGWPSVPFHRLPLLREAVKDRLVHRSEPWRLYARRGASPLEVDGSTAASRRCNSARRSGSSG